ncbi:MAG: hypothetical protein U0T75_00835 [Chitinophagales bacterium]
MKKLFVLALVFTVALMACNRKTFVKKLVGTWKLDRYVFDGQDKSNYFDTTFRGYTLDLSEDQRYVQSYTEFSFAADSFFTYDTLGYDSVNMVYIIDEDTVYTVDTTITPHIMTGSWELINSEEDLQLRNDSTPLSADIYRILDLDKSNLKLRKGNEEFYFGK